MRQFVQDEVMCCWWEVCSLIILFSFSALVMVVHSGPSGEHAVKETGTHTESDIADAKAGSASNKADSGSDYGRADFDGPGDTSEQPIEVMLTVAGSEGGVYKGWVHRDETNIGDR